MKTLNSNHINYHCFHVKSLDSVKYFGVAIDQCLKWDIYVFVKTVKKVRSMFYKFKTLNNILASNAMRMIECAVDQSIFSYGIADWGRGAYDTNLKKLVTTINSLIRVAFKKPYKTLHNILI